MNIDKLKTAEQIFLSRHPDGFQEPEMLEIAKKHKIEKMIIAKMISIYCRGKHNSDELCRDCSNLLDYCGKKIDSCRWIENKPNCSSCTTVCFSKENREKLRKIMRFSGPRLLYLDPAAIFLWIFRKLFNKRENWTE